MDKKVYGIDLGTTYSVIASLDSDGRPEVFDFLSEGERVMASAVYFQDDGTPVVGKEAKAMAETEPEKVVQFVKRQIGKENVKFTFGGVEYDPVTISALILKRIKEDMEEQGHDVSDVVITCPAYFGNTEKIATRQAGQIAGLNVLNIIHEPTAAALSYCSREFGEPRKIMVYDLGGGTFDVTLLNFSVDEDGKNAAIDVIDSNGDDQLGGIDWDKRLYSYICKLYSEQSGIPVSKIDDDTQIIIRSKVEDLKKGLSRMNTKSISVGDERIEITVENFENETRDLVERTTNFVHQLLNTNGLTPEDISVVLLVGGSSKMPMIQKAVKDIFPGKVRVEDPDFAVAKGAAIAAYMTAVSEGKTEGDGKDTTGEGGTGTGDGGGITIIPPVTISDKLSRAFGPAIWTEDSSGNKSFMINNLLFRGDSSPASKEETYGTMADNQEMIVVPIYENMGNDHTAHEFIVPSEDENGNPQATDPSLNVKKIGELTLTLEPGTPAHSPIRVKFESSTKGIIVYAIDERTGKSVHSEIEAETLKSDEELLKDTQHLAKIRTKGTV